MYQRRVENMRRGCRIIRRVLVVAVDWVVLRSKQGISHGLMDEWAARCLLATSRAGQLHERRMETGGLNRIGMNRVAAGGIWTLGTR